jgi:hypothetical protein
MSNHHAKLENSRRLQVLAAILSDGREHSTLDLEVALRERGIINLAISPTISELRTNGFPIPPARRVKGAERPTWVYRMGRR